ncbi:MAG: hypothetical protein ACRDMH_02500 [Solirubrobacterales bacterium]
MSDYRTPETISFSIRDDAGRVEHVDARPDGRRRELGELIADVEQLLDEDRENVAQSVALIVKRDGIGYAEALGQVLALLDSARELDQWTAESADPERLALHQRVQARAARESIDYGEALRQIDGEEQP